MPRLGQKMSEEAKVKIGNFRRGKKHSEQHKDRIAIAQTGKKHPHTEETKRKISNSKVGKPNLKLRGSLNPSWKRGISKNPYPQEFNSTLKLKIRQRDNFKCCKCGKSEREELEELNRVLCVNHIDFNKSNCTESNLNTLCVRCNVEINRNREHWTDYFKQNY